MRFLSIIIFILAFNTFASTEVSTGTKKKKVKKESKTISADASQINTSSSGSSIKTLFKGEHPFLNEVLVNFSSGSISNIDSETTIHLMGSYLRHIKDNFQGGAEVGLDRVYSSTAFNLTVIGAYNLDKDFKNSIYGKVGLGLFSVTGVKGSDSTTKFGAFVGGGKRFPLFNNVTYSPELRVIKKGDLDVYFEATFLNLSLYWN